MKTASYNQMSFSYHSLLPNQAIKKAERLGLSYAERKAIYKEAVANSGRSMNEADLKYPPSKYLYKNIDYQRSLKKQYDEKLARKYRLTFKQLKTVIFEGVKNSWPSS